MATPFFDAISQMEPLMPSRDRLEEKALSLLRSAEHLSGKLHPITQQEIAKLLRLMNSYYSNLIEGNTTHPLDLERAEKNDYSSDPRKYALQQEGKAHIEVQQFFEEEVRSNPTLDVCSPEFLCRIHKAFYEKLPQEFRIIRSSNGKESEVIPGEFRKEEVVVGNHVPPTHTSIAAFLDRFQEKYSPNSLGTIDKILAAAASHHRLAWIHPFLDGNGRVVRLATHLYFIRAGLDSNGLWALSRGLARKREEYYKALAAADNERYNDYDGRGTLSLRGLNEFAEFLLDVAIDQVQFMSSLLDIDNALQHLVEYADLLAMRKEIDETAKYLLKGIFLEGEVPRGEVKHFTGKSERVSSSIVRKLIQKELVYSQTPYGPLRLRFPVKAVPYLFPALFPQGI